jgi:hypothetical protein
MVSRPVGQVQRPVVLRWSRSAMQFVARLRNSSRHCGSATPRQLARTNLSSSRLPPGPVTVPDGDLRVVSVGGRPCACPVGTGASTAAASSCR